MLIYTKVVIDMSSGDVVESRHYEYSALVALCKRGAPKSETLGMANQNQATANMVTQLQKGMLTPQTSFLQNMMTSPTGFTPADLSAMRTQAMQNTADQFGSGLSQLKASLASRGLTGGATPTSGLAANNFGQYLAQGAQAQSQNLANINIQNALQAQQNRWNAAQTLGNYAGIFNPSSYIGGATGQMGNLTNLYTAPTVGGNILTKLTPSFSGTMKIPS